MPYRSAELYDLINGWKDYANESARLAELIDRELPGARSLLDVGCGSGLHLELLRARFEVVEGTDIDAGMLEAARMRLPGVPLHLGDMLELDLGRSFDVVTCLFGAVAHMVKIDRLDRAVARLAAHVRPGGLLLVEPWITAESFTGDGIVGVRTAERPGVALARVHRTRRDGSQCDLSYGYQLAGPDGIEQFTETHRLGVFSEAEYRSALEQGGLEVEWDPEGPMGRGLLIGRRTAAVS